MLRAKSSACSMIEPSAAELRESSIRTYVHVIALRQRPAG